MRVFLSFIHGYKIIAGREYAKVYLFLLLGIPCICSFPRVSSDSQQPEASATEGALHRPRTEKVPQRKNISQRMSLNKHFTLAHSAVHCPGHQHLALVIELRPSSLPFSATDPQTFQHATPFSLL